MNAAQLVVWKDKDLVGMSVITQPMGAYPGGLGIVTEIRPDPEAPDLAFNVENEVWTDDEGGHEIGIFTYEDVVLMEDQ